MKKGFWTAIITGMLVGIPALSALALDADAERGKAIFMKKGTSGKACMTCHPKGLTTNETYKGKDIPDLTERSLSEAKLRRKTLRFLKVQGTSLSEAELADLLAFERALPREGFGPVPAEWQPYVKQKLGQ